MFLKIGGRSRVFQVIDELYCLRPFARRPTGMFTVNSIGVKIKSNAKWYNKGRAFSSIITAMAFATPVPLNCHPSQPVSPPTKKKSP